MEETIRPSGVVRFGVFEVDLRAEELRKNGGRIRLRGQAFQVLAILLERPGQIVTREELQQRLWPSGTFVDFDHGLNTAINKIREVLGDSAENPRFVETLARRGYRFIATVQNGGRDTQVEMVRRAPAASSLPAAVADKPLEEKESRRQRSLSARHLVGLVALSVLVIGGVVWFNFSRLGSKTLPPMKVVRLTSFQGPETDPALSPDGKMVAFVWGGEKGDNSDIYLMPVDAGSPFRLTNDPGDDSHPAWSPDGRYIAFHRFSKETSGIYLVPSLGGVERRLLAEDRFMMGGKMDWSPDGKSLAFSATESLEQPLKIFLLSVETGEKRQVTFPAAGFGGDVAPAFSPDGRTLAFSRFAGVSEVDIYTTPLKGTNTKRLTFDQRSIEGTWTPDGREIVFSRRTEGTKVDGLYRIPAAGGKRVPLVEGGQFGGSPSISQQGNRLVYAEGIYNPDIYRIDLAVSKDKVPSISRLISSSQEDTTPGVSPDGRKVAFCSNQSGSAEIWVCDSDGRKPVRLTSFGGPYVTGSPSWSPDGKFIAFDSRPKGLSDIFVISADGGSPRCLTGEDSDDVVPTWSRDGRWIYFGSTPKGKVDWQLWKIPIAGGLATQVTRKGGFYGSESFDRTLIFYCKGYRSNEIWSVPASGGEESLFLSNATYRFWAVAEQGIYFIGREDREVYLKFIDFAKRQVSRIARVEKEPVWLDGGLAFSPNGRALLCALVEQDGSDIMLVENFR